MMHQSAKPIVLISGSLAQRPGQGGHTWVFLQYLLGFKRLGWEPLFVDWLAPEMCVDAAGRACSLHDSENLRYFLDVMSRFGLRDSFSLLRTGTRDTVGLSRNALLEKARSCEFLINVMGFLKDEEVLAAVPQRVFLDIDPGFGQMWQGLGLHNLFAGHDAFVTIGLNVGLGVCNIPTCGLDWITTLQPVVLDLWPLSPPSKSGAFTSIASWRGIFGPIEYRGTTYGLRVHEFRKFAALPARSPHRFEFALDIHPSETRDLELLKTNRWNLVDPHAAAGDPWRYQRFITNSLAEFTVAKNLYVATNSGWFSDRSICYLASGRPVIAQDTHLREHLPSGQGLLLFSTIDEAAAAVEAVAADPANHGKAAREISQEILCSDRVLKRLVDQLARTRKHACAAS